MAFDIQREKFREEIGKLEQTVERKDKERKKVKEMLDSERQRIEELKDPKGLHDFRRLINQFTSGLDSIVEEKELQYKTMKNIVEMLDDFGKRSNVSKDTRVKMRQKSKQI